MTARARVGLPEQLKDCPEQARKLFEKAEADGISRHAFCRIRQELGIQTAQRDVRWWNGECHANLFPLKKQEEKTTKIRAPLTGLRVPDFTVPGGVRILNLRPRTGV